MIRMWIFLYKYYFLLMLILTAGVASFFWFDKLSSDDPTSLRYDVVPTIVSIYNKIKARCLIGQLPV